MSTSIDNRQPGYAGVNINCFTIDPTKLPPDSPLLKNPPCCVSNNMPLPCYPQNYYVNNFNNDNSKSCKTKKKRVQQLTDNYIKNLEAFLNSPSKEIRKNAAQEVIKRFDEDKDRYDDAALNALINKMLKDPDCHQVKNTALFALESGLAQGNQNTVPILEFIKDNDTSRNGADAISAANILLRMSSPTDIIEIPENNSENNTKSDINNTGVAE